MELESASSGFIIKEELITEEQKLGAGNTQTELDNRTGTVKVLLDLQPKCFSELNMMQVQFVPRTIPDENVKIELCRETDNDQVHNVPEQQILQNVKIELFHETDNHMAQNVPEEQIGLLANVKIELCDEMDQNLMPSVPIPTEQILPTKKNRKRGTCFKEDETELLVALVAKYKAIVENKTTNGKTWQEKEEAWRQIGNEFTACSSGGTKRSVACLKNKYNLIKKILRKKSACIRQERLSGLCGSETPRLDPVEEKVKTLILKSVDESEGEFHGDDEVEVQEDLTVLKPSESCVALATGGFQVVENVNPPHCEVVITEPVINSDNAQFELVTPNERKFNWSSYSRNQLKEKKNKLLSCSKQNKLKNNSASSMQKLLELKLELAQLMKEELIEESRRKAAEFQQKAEDAAELMEQQREEHKLKMKMMNLDILLKKQQMGYSNSN